MAYIEEEQNSLLCQSQLSATLRDLTNPKVMRKVHMQCAPSQKKAVYVSYQPRQSTKAHICIQPFELRLSPMA